VEIQKSLLRPQKWGNWSRAEQLVASRVFEYSLHAAVARFRICLVYQLGGSHMDVEAQSSPRCRDEGRRRRSKRLSRAFAATFCAVGLAIGFSACTNGETKKDQRAGQQVSLEAANSPGLSPWMDSTTAGDLPSTLNRVENTATGSPNNQGGIWTVSGDQVGLYGGSPNGAVCDRGKMVDFLERHPAEAQAWRTVTGVSDIRAYVNALSPVVLTHDTRVTNHGFENGTVTYFESVLQTGTAVMVDNRGIPRVRCASGSPLAQPQSDVSAQYTGTGWQGLDTHAVITVQQSDAPIENLALVSEPAGGAALPSSATATGSPTTTAAAPPSPLFLTMPVGDTQAMPAPGIGLPPGKTVVRVQVTPPLNSETSSVTSSVRVSTSGATSPSTTTTSASSSVSGSPSPTASSATSTVPATTTGR
jgi:hypothetical protein